MRILSDEEIDALCPSKEEQAAYLSEPTPPDKLNQLLDKYLTPEIKQSVAFDTVHCRKVAKAQRGETLKEVGAWGEQECTDHRIGLNARRKPRRRECIPCWQALLRGELEEK